MATFGNTRVTHVTNTSCRNCESTVPNILDVLAVLQSELKELKSGLRSELKQLKSGLRSELKELGSGLRSELQQVKTELKSELSAVNNKCSQVLNEVLDTSSVFGSTTTLRQIVDKTGYDVECLRERVDETEVSRRGPGLEDQSGDDQESTVDSVDTFEQSSTRADESVKPFVPADIIVDTVAEEVDLMKTEIEAIKLERTLVKGRSFGGKSVLQLAQAIPSPRCPVSLVLVINNFLDQTVRIVKTWVHPSDRNLLENPQLEIAVGRKEVLKLSSKRATAGLILLAIDGSPIRLVLACRNMEGNKAGVCAFLTTRAAIELDSSLDSYLRDIPDELWERSTTIAYDPEWEGAEVFAELGDIRIRSATEKGKHSTASLDIGSVEGLESCSTRRALVPSSLETREPLLTPPSASPESLLATISRRFACVIQIGNALLVNMKEPQYFLELGAGSTIPEKVGVLASASAVVCYTREFQGMISYGLGETDLRLTIGFRVREEDPNELAIGLVPVKTPQDSQLLRLLFEENPNFSEPDVAHGKAMQGTLRISRRNIVAEAKMTNLRGAVLEVLISTF